MCPTVSGMKILKKIMQIKSNLPHSLLKCHTAQFAGSSIHSYVSHETTNILHGSIHLPLSHMDNAIKVDSS